MNSDSMQISTINSTAPDAAMSANWGEMKQVYLLYPVCVGGGGLFLRGVARIVSAGRK